MESNKGLGFTCSIRSDFESCTLLQGSFVVLLQGTNSFEGSFELAVVPEGKGHMCPAVKSLYLHFYQP